jgi:hypothetical protein
VTAAIAKAERPKIRFIVVSGPKVGEEGGLRGFEFGFVDEEGVVDVGKREGLVCVDMRVGEGRRVSVKLVAATRVRTMDLQVVTRAYLGMEDTFWLQWQIVGRMIGVVEKEPRW